MFFTNLPIRYIAQDSRYLAYFTGERHLPPTLDIGPELGMDAFSLDALDEAFHQNLANLLAERSLSCSIHLPFIDLSPGSADKLILQASKERLRKAISLARIYAPKHLVGHPFYIESMHPDRDAWLERSLGVWEDVLNQVQTWESPAPLYLENTFETSPDVLSALQERLLGANVGVCFDLGHWFSFAGGRRKQNLHAWLDAFAPYLKHLHLHDNNGDTDAHLPLGQGAIPWRELSETLQARKLAPTATLEPHSEEDFLKTLAYAVDNLSVFTPLGVY